MSKITIVIGPPCAGKSTYCREHAQPGDVVVDFDLLAQSLGNPAAHETSGGLATVAHAVRKAAIDTILGGITADAWVIHTLPEPERLEAYAAAAAEFVLLDPGEEECVRRALADGRPEKTIDVIADWYKSPPALPAEAPLKGGPSMFKLYRAQIKTDEAEQGIVEMLVSTYGVDSWGDRVIPGAFKETLAEWKASGNPIPFIWSHQHDDPLMHIGFVTEAEERPASKDFPGGLWVKAQIDMEDVPENREARKAYRLLKGKRVNQASFAYDVIEGAPAKDNGRDVFDLRKLKLYEVGPTLIGMNQETQLINAKAIANLHEGLKVGRTLSAKNEELIRSAHESLGEVLSALQESAGEPEGMKKALPVHHTATSDKSWDGPAAEKNLKADGSEAYYRSAHAWQDPDGDPETKAAYKFVHHEVSADGTVGAANLIACSAGIAVLNGGRGGTTIPDADHQGVWKHLGAHIDDAGKDVPPLKGGSEPATTQEPSPATVQEPMRTTPLELVEHQLKALELGL